MCVCVTSTHLAVAGWHPRMAGCARVQSCGAELSRWARPASRLSPGAPAGERTARSHARTLARSHPRSGLNTRGVGSAGGGGEAFTVAASQLTKKPLASKKTGVVSLKVSPARAPVFPRARCSTVVGDGRCCARCGMSLALAGVGRSSGVGPQPGRISAPSHCAVRALFRGR